MTLRKLSIIGLFGLFTQSWAADLPAHGTWVGTIGQYPITMCLATDDKGTYRYQGHSGEINLIRMQSDWVEVVNGAVTGRWVLANSAPSELNGSWESGNGTTTLPIALTLSNSGRL